MLDLFDTHTHLDADDFDADRDLVISRARQAGVRRLVTIGIGGSAATRAAIALAEKYDFIWASAGVHPHDAKVPVDLTELRQFAAHPRVVAIGETGLDYFRDWAPKDLQEQWFRAQVKLALEIKKPIIIHSREAGQDCLRILEEEGASAIGGVFHCFSEDAAFAAKLREINFLISVPGSVTFKKAEALRATIKAVPLEQIMLETDAPYLAPEPNRGQRCESALMVDTARCLAALKGLSLEELGTITTATAMKFFKLI